MSESLEELSRVTGLPETKAEAALVKEHEGLAELNRLSGSLVFEKDQGGTSFVENARSRVDLGNIYTDPIENYVSYGVPLNAFSDWNEQRALRQSTGQKWKNGLIKAGITTVGAVTENTLGVLAGLGEMATGGSYYDNFVGKGVDKVNDWAQTNLPNYYSKQEQNQSVLAGLGSANFWADKVANGVGYSLGSIATMWLGTGELGLMAKAIGGAAKIASKGAKAIGIAGKTGAVLEDAAMLGSKQLAMYRAGKAIETGAKLERMAGVARFSTAAQRLGVATQMSLAESSVEAREAKNRFIEEETAKWEELNPGQDVPEDVMNGIIESGNAVGNTTFAINLPILATSNLIMFRNMFRGANVGERAIYNLERTAVNPAKWAQSMGDGKLAKAFTNAGRIFSKPLTGMVTEGFQEGSQFAASEFSRDYYGSKFSDGFGDMSKSISQSLSATFGTKEGLENMLIGAIVGGGTGAVSRIAGADSKLAKARTANSEKALEALNSGGLTRVIQTMEQNDYNVRRVNIMDMAQKKMSDPEATSSQKMQAKQAFERAQTQLIRSEARRYSKMGALDYFLEQLEDAKAMPEKEFKEAFGFDVSIPLLDQAGKSQSEIVDGVKKTVELSEKRALQVEAILAKYKPKATFLPKIIESFQSDKTKNSKHIQGVVRNMYANMLHERLLDIDVLDNQIDDTYRELEKLSPAISNMGMEEFVYQMNVGNISVTEEGKIAIKSGSTIKADKKLASQLNEIYTAKKRLNPADSMEFRDVAIGLAELLKSREIAATAMDNLTRNPEEMDLVMQYEYAKKQEEARQANAERAAQVVAGAETADEIRDNLPEDASPEMIAEAEARIAQLEEEESIARASMADMTDEELEEVNEDEIPPVSASALAKEKDERENAERIRQQQRSIDPTQVEQVDTPQQAPSAASYVDTVERMQEVSDAEEAALGDISISAGGKIFTISGTTYLNLAENPTDAIIYDENGERIGVELTDAATGVKVSWKLSEDNEEESAIVESTTYAILLNAASIRSDEDIAKQSNAEALTILEIRGDAAIEDVLEKQNKEIEAAQEKAKGKLKQFELTQSQEDFEAFEKEQAEVAKLVATTNLGETEGMTDGQIRTQIEVIKQDLIEFYEILDEERKIALSQNPNLTEKEFNERPSVITVKAITKTHEALFQKKVEELRNRKQAKKTINEEAPAPAEIEETVPQNEIDELLQSTQNKINRLENEIAEFAKYADEYQKMVDGTYPDQNVDWATAKLKKLNAKIATRKATIQKEKDLIQRINDERESEKLRQASNAPEGTDTTTEGEESETTDLNPRAGSTEEGMDGTTTEEELELIRQRFEEQSKFEDEDPANFEEPEDATGLKPNDVTLSVEGPMDIQLVVGSVTPGKNPDGTKNWNITIVGSTGNSTNTLPKLKTDGQPISMYPEYLSDAEETPVNTTVIFRVDEKSDWWNSEDPDPKYNNNKKDLTEDNYWKQVPIYMVVIRPNGTEEIVGLLQSANSESGASRRDIYELYKKGLTPSATILGKKFNKSNIANARTTEGQTFFYPASTIAGENPVIAVVTQKDMMPVWTASTTDENVAITIESASADNVTLGQVAIVVPNPEGTPTVIVASTKDMTPEGATKAIDYIIADEPQAELYSEIVGVNRLPVNIENEEDTIKIEGQTEDPFSERFIATNRLTDGTELFSFYSKSANAIVRLNAEELKKALLGQPFRFSFSEAAPNERGWVELRTVKKPDVAYKAVSGNLAQEFRDITMKKKFQVALGSMMNNQQYVSPISGKTYNSYFEYLSSTEEFSEPRTEGLGANAILTVDTLANNQGSPFHDVGVKLSQLTTLEGDVKTEEELELKQVVASTTTNTVPQPATTASTDVQANRDTEMFPETSNFAQAIGDSESVLENEIKKARYIQKDEKKAQELEAELERRQSKLSSYAEVNGIGMAVYTNPISGVVDVIMSGTSDNDYVGYVRLYVNDKPTNRWTSKISNESGNKEAFKTMLSEVQSRLPVDHEYTESTNISLEGLKLYAQQLNREYEVLTDASGNPVMSSISLNAASKEGLRNAKSQQEKEDLYNPITVANREEFNKIKEEILALMPNARALYNEANNTVNIQLPVLKKKAGPATTTTTTTTQPASVIEGVPNEVAKIIEEVIANSEFIVLSPDEKTYINKKTGQVYQRVTTYINEKEDLKDTLNKDESLGDYRKRLESLEYSDKEISQKLLLASSQVIGTKIDIIVRDFFSGTLKDLSEYDASSLEEIEGFVKELEKIKKAMDARGEKVLANDIVLYNDKIGVAGTVDLLTYDAQGNIRIYDTKTMRGNNFIESYAGDSKNKFETERYGKSKKDSWTDQVSLYRILLNNTHGLKAKTIGALPIEISYNSGDSSTKKLNLLKGVTLSKLDTVKNAELEGTPSPAEKAPTTSLESLVKSVKEETTPIEGLNERLDAYGNAAVVLPTNFNEGPRPKGRLNAFKSSIIKVASDIQVLADLNLNEFDFLTDEDKKRLEALKPLAQELKNINVTQISNAEKRTTAVEKRFAELTNKLANEFVDIINKHVQEQLGKEITSSKPTTALTTTAPAVVQAPAAPRVTSSSQVIADDLSLLMNLSRESEEKPVPSTTEEEFDLSKYAVTPEKQAELRAEQAAELKKALGKPVVGPPTTDFGTITAAKAAEQEAVRKAAEDKGKENDC